jgi:hypothetical protein
VVKEKIKRHKGKQAWNKHCKPISNGVDNGRVFAVADAKGLEGTCKSMP